MKRSMTCCFVLIATCCLAGPKGVINVKNVADGSITVDGNFGDWALDQYTQVAEQPVFPDARDSDATDAIGDHIVFDRDRAGFFNGSDPFELDNSPTDFGSSVYFAYDSNALFILAVFLDDVLKADRDDTQFGSSGFLNDGFEFFLDLNNDSLDRADEIAFPAFDEEEPNLEDLQITVGLNQNFPPENPGADDIGARQGVERAGNIELIGENKNGPFAIYRDLLNELNDAGTQDVAAKSYSDLRAAGALNPEILANPDEPYMGYAIEMLVPFEFLPEFTPDHDVGFDLFWRDHDGDELCGGCAGALQWADWAQNTDVPSDEEGNGLFHTSNWGLLRFGEGGTDPVCGDFDGDGDVDVADRTIQVQNWTGALAEGEGSATFEQGDCDGDGDVDTADQTGLIQNWTGALAGNLVDGGDADLIYNPQTGNVTLDASDTNSGVLISFVLGTNENDMRPENFTTSDNGSAGPFIDVGTNTDAKAFQIGQTDPINQGAGPLIDLGDIFPTGIESVEALAEYLSLAEYASELGSGGSLDLRFVPEPSGFVLLLIGAIAFRRRRQ